MATVTQDLPPKGGYGPIRFERLKLRTVVKGWPAIFGYLSTTCIGGYLYYMKYKMNRKRIIEMQSSHLAVLPVLIAERDRAILKHMRLLREEETDLMKDVNHWETGTYFGQPKYETLPKDTYMEPIFSEYVIHSHIDDYFVRYNHDLII